MSTAKPYQTVYKFKNVHLKNHKPKTPCFFTQGDHRKASKVMKVFLLNVPPLLVQPKIL